MTWSPERRSTRGTHRRSPEPPRPSIEAWEEVREEEPQVGMVVGGNAAAAAAAAGAGGGAKEEEEEPPPLRKRGTGGSDASSIDELVPLATGVDLPPMPLPTPPASRQPSHVTLEEAYAALPDISQEGLASASRPKKPSGVDRAFARIDVNGDGVLSRIEVIQACPGTFLEPSWSLHGS